MLTKKLLQITNNKIINILGDEVGFGGADGQVFELLYDQHKVIKISVLYDYYNDLENRYNNTIKVLNYLKSNSPDCCAKVFDYDIIDINSRATVNGDQKYILYYSIMEKCNKITEDEKKVFHTLVSHEDRNIIKNFYPKNITTILNGLSYGLDFDSKKIIKFCKDLNSLMMKHQDLHPRNIMKKVNGNFCLIDFDRCSF